MSVRVAISARRASKNFPEAAGATINFKSMNLGVVFPKSGGLPHDGIEALDSTFERRSQLRAKAFPDERYAGHPHRNCHVAGGKQYRRFVAHDHAEMLGGRNGCLGRRNPNRSRKPRLRLPNYP